MAEPLLAGYQPMPEDRRHPVASVWNSVMSDVRFADLSPRQKECLRLVARGMNTKEVAAELGISPETARSHIDAARARIGVDRRAAAARLLVQHEGETPPPREGTPVTGMAEDPFVPHAGPVSSADTRSTPAMNDVARPAYLAMSSPSEGIRWPFRTAGRRFNDLAWWEQLAWAVAIAVGSIVAIHEVAAFLRG